MKRKSVFLLGFLIVSLALTLIHPVFATELFSDGFESNNFDEWYGTLTSTGETATTETTDPHHGTYHAKFSCDASSTGEYALARELFDPAQPIVYARGYFKIKTALPASEKEYQFITFIADSTEICWLKAYNDAGTVKWRVTHYDGASGCTHTAETGPSLDTWYCLELYEKIHATEGEVKLYVNGVDILSHTSVDTDNFGNIAQFRMGEVYSSGQTAHDIYLDCVVVADAYIGPEVGEYTEEFTETTGITASLYLWKALFEKYEETITVSATSYGWKEKASFQTETTTVTEQINEWKELKRFFTESIIVTETASFGMELLLEILELSELIEFDATMYLTFQIIAPEVEPSTFGTLSLVIAIIALAIAVTAFAAKTKD